MFPYMGGKSKISKWIFENMPKVEWKRYTEIFGGAFWVYLRQNINAPEYYYNDYNPFLANVWTLMAYSREELLENLKHVKLNDKETFHATKKFIKSRKEGFDIPNMEIGVKYIYLLSHCFSGDISGGMKLTDNAWPRIIKKLNDQYFINKLDNITEVHNKSYVDLIPLLDIAGGFFYVDPPYYGKEHLYGFHNFTKDDHYKLADILKECKSEWILSYYDYGDLRHLYPEDEFIWLRREYTRSSSAVPGKPGKGEELLIFRKSLEDMKKIEAKGFETFFI